MELVERKRKEEKVFTREMLKKIGYFLLFGFAMKMREKIFFSCLGFTRNRKRKEKVKKEGRLLKENKFFLVFPPKIKN